MTALPALTYHALGPGSTMSPGRFEQHLRVLAAGAAGPSLWPAELPTARRGFLLTFDDGYADLWTHGLELLERRDLRAVVFAIPSRAGEGPERPRGETVAAGEAGDVPREGPHPLFLRWSELAALEASGRVRVESHSLHHRAGWGGDRPRGFHLGEALHGGVAQANGGDLRLGIPLFPRRSELAGPVFRDHARVRDGLCAWLKARGGAGYVAERGEAAVAAELERQWLRLTHDGDDAGRWETPAEREGRTLEQLTGAREALEQRLGGKRVEFCLPWGEYDALTLELARRAGYQRVYTLRRRPNPVGAVGFLVHRFEPRPRGAAWLRSRLWIYRSTWRARWYGRLGGRA